MSEPLPRPADFSQHIDGPDDPRFAQIAQQLKPGVDLAGRVREILKSVDHIRTAENGRIHADDLARAAARPQITEMDLTNCKLEIHQINGHLVYYIQPKHRIDPGSFATAIARPALGGVWEHFEIEGWVDQEPNPQLGVTGWVWGILIRGLRINAMTRALYMSSIPKAFDKLLAPA